MEATLRCLEAPMQPAAVHALDDGRACAQPTPAQGSAAARPNSAQVNCGCEDRSKLHNPPKAIA